MIAVSSSSKGHPRVGMCVGAEVVVGAAVVGAEVGLGGRVNGLGVFSTTGAGVGSRVSICPARPRIGIPASCVSSLLATLAANESAMAVVGNVISAITFDDIL